MSADAVPISAAAFAQAIQDLPMENLYSKAAELNNSIAHLERSNKELKEYIDHSTRATTTTGSNEDHDQGDKEFLEAIAENEVVINRQKERIDLLKAEVERRGSRWHETETGAGAGIENENENENDTEENGVVLNGAGDADEGQDGLHL